jgi:hypothetical protein
MTAAFAPQLEAAQESEPRGDTAGVIAPPPLIYLGALGIGFGLHAVIGKSPLRHGHRADGVVPQRLPTRPDAR